jgi:hypothetical protein
VQTFAQRMRVAESWEAELRDRLRAEGWVADSFGQGQLPKHQRELLKRVRTPARWMPDMVAQRPEREHSLCIFIDAKAGDTFRKTGNHDIEAASLDALIQWKRFSKVPCLVITQDWKIHDVERVAALCWDGAFRGFGSGTPFKLWKASDGIEWDSYFFDYELLEMVASYGVNE